MIAVLRSWTAGNKDFQEIDFIDSRGADINWEKGEERKGLHRLSIGMDQSDTHFWCGHNYVSLPGATPAPE